MAKQSSARGARKIKTEQMRRPQLFLVRLPARGWIASLRSQ
jgi:hypothetical protein